MANDNEALNSDLVSTVAELLDVDAAEIRAKPDATFVQLGGDSVRALQLTFRLDESDLSLDLETILDEGSSLEQLSRILGPSRDGSDAKLDEQSSSSGDGDELKRHAERHQQKGDRRPIKVPGSGYQTCALLPDTESEDTIREAANQIDCSTDDIEHVLPVTSQQKLLWLGSLQKPGAYLAHWCFNVPDSVDAERLRKAWLEVLESTPILRARFVLGVNESLRQAIVSASQCHDLWTECHEEAVPAITPDYGQPLIKFGIECSSSRRRFHLHAHHAVYDRWSMQLTFDDVRRKYNDQSSRFSARPLFIPYLEPLKPDERDELTNKWKSFLGDTFLTPVPDLAATDKPSGAKNKLERSCHLSSSPATKAELVTAAWSWVCSKQANSSDISFGLTVWGRDVALRSVTEMAFPTFRTLPICMRLQPENSISGLLKATKMTLSSLRHLQRLSFEEISSISDVSKQACRFNSIVVVQSEPAERTHQDSDVLRPKDLIFFDLKQGHQLVVECTPRKSDLKISLQYHPDYIATEFAESLLSHFCMALEALSAGGEELCDTIDMFSDEDDRLVREWIRPCEEAKPVPMYSMVAKQAAENPESVALWTTQSKMTYSDLMDYARKLSQVLQRKKITGHVGICLERSAMAVVAQIGISMSGCAFVPLDPSNPTARLDQIIQDSDMTLLVCSQATSNKFNIQRVPVLVLDDQLLASQDADLRTRTEPEPISTAYVIYTSGSTGTPKGVVIEHGQISTSLSAQTKFFNVDRETRTLQFASLAFDMSIHEIYMTLGVGGTVCIPTDAERFELDDFLAEAKPNYSMLTPSVAATLSKTSLARIQDIALCGEPLYKGSIERVLQAGSNPWVVYGPTETSIINLGHKADSSTHRFNLGYSFGATAWIVSINDPHELAPVGIPGELAFSGHTLAAGYYKDAEKTDAAFRTGLRWVENFHNVPNDRVYLTGDLARYNSDGTIQFLGRIGGYTKIAGNRVDLDEIKYVLVNKCDLPDATVLLCNIEERDMLLCFFADPSRKAVETDGCTLVDFSRQAKSNIATAISTLEQTLPKYMMPSAWIPVNKIPITISGKLDSGSLRRQISNLDVEALLTNYSVDASEGQNVITSEVDDAVSVDNRRLLSKAWAAVLSVKESNINANSHFVRLGGDSLRAMELASNLRKSGLSLHVADIFASPVLKDMAGKLQQRKSNSEIQLKPMFSDSEREDLLLVASETLQIERDSIESISLCSSLQSQLMVASEQSRGSFLHRDCFKIDQRVARDEISSVCSDTIEQNEMLRTRIFVDTESGRFMQVVVRHISFKLEVREATLEEYLAGQLDQPLKLGGPLCRFVLLRSEPNNLLVWELHHSIYDGHSHIILLNKLRSSIEKHQDPRNDSGAQKNTSASGKYHKFIQYLLSVDREPAREFWSSYLKGSTKNTLSVLKAVPPQSLTDKKTKMHVQVTSKKSNFTTATYLRAVFALLISGYAASSDVTFAATINGRDLPVDGIADLAGPTFATIPVRIQFKFEETVKSLLSRVQKDSAQSASYQTLPIEDISRISPACKQACQFDVHLLVQSQSLAMPDQELAKLGYEMMEKSPMQLRIPFNVVATTKQDGFELEAIYNQSAIDSTEVHLLLDQMSALLQSLVSGEEDETISSILTLGKQNKKLIEDMQLRSEQNLESASTIPDLVLRHLDGSADKEAIYSTESSLTYRQLYEQAQAFAAQIREKLDEPHSMVAFCFEKSLEAIVAQLAIMLAGHTFVPIDPSWPAARRSSVLEQTGSPLIVSSKALANTFNESSVNVLTLEHCNRSKHASANTKSSAKSSAVAYCLFTSGSTGKPKGVIVEHGAISRTLQAYAKRLSFTAETRALLFASFTFDASIMETWSVLVAGGTLCIADDEERISDLSGFISRSRADCVGITPTAAGLLQAEELSNIKTLLFCGEKCRERDLAQWRERDVVLVNAYGPTEACVNAATNIDFVNADLDDVGTSLGGGLWIVDSGNADRILPVGCIGELVISGPVLAQGYLNAPDITAERFIKPKWPEWTKVTNGPVYRTGDLARLDAAGRLHLLGRSDGQMKLNGMRVEAEEVEHACSQADITVTDIVASTVYLSEESHELAVFFLSAGAMANKGAEMILPLSKRHSDLIAAMQTIATRLLPLAFVPTLYIPVSRIPFSTSGKVDRKLLSEAAGQLHSSQLGLFRAGDDNLSGTSTPKVEPYLNGTNPKNEPLSSAEEYMQSLWTTVLNTTSSATSLTPDSHFTETGGDSVAAIRLAAIAKSKGKNLPVSVIYANPRLRDMAKAIETRPAAAQRIQSVNTPGAFEMIQDIEILSPAFSTPSPQMTRGKRNDYFGQAS